ncbi:MAG: hypothetical protein GX053_11825 [Tissierella sp.]|nr:hypothetical protein [Tissierella sp.]
MDLSPNVIKFFAIIFCFVISVISNPLNNQSKNIFLLQLGLIFTIMADYIFLIRNNNYILAVGLFSIVQIIYSLRYREGNEVERVMRFIILYLLMMILYKILNRSFIEIDFLIIIAIFYGICLISSVREAWLLYKSDNKQNANKMILFGMILFLLCDLNLGLNYILNETTFMGNPPNLLKAISSISIWAYYLPSQLLLALSGSEL